MKRAALAVLLLASLGLAACGDDRPLRAFDREGERRAVMCAVLTEEYGATDEGNAAGRFVLDPDLVVSPRAPLGLVDGAVTVGARKAPATVELPDGRRVRAPTLEGLDPRLISDWAAHGTQAPAPRDLDLPLPLDWFSAADWEALEGVVVTGERAHDSPKWQAFHLKHPASAGWISLSDVGFSPDGDQALIYVAVGCGSLCGSGHWYVLEKRDGRWLIAVKKMAWVS